MALVLLVTMYLLKVLMPRLILALLLLKVLFFNVEWRLTKLGVLFVWVCIWVQGRA